MTEEEVQQLKKRIRQLPNSVSGDGTIFAEQLKKALEEIVNKLNEISNAS